MNERPRRAQSTRRRTTRLSNPRSKCARPREEKRKEHEEAEDDADVLPGHCLIGRRVSGREDEKENKHDPKKRAEDRMAAAPVDLLAKPDHLSNSSQDICRGICSSRL